MVQLSDIFFTGMIANKILRCELQDDQGFGDYNPEFAEEPCILRDLITAGGIKVINNFRLALVFLSLIYKTFFLVLAGAITSNVGQECHYNSELRTLL